MLILTRRSGESINIGDDIIISIVEVKGKSVRVGVEAPSSMSIHREEVYAMIKEQNRKASAWKDVNMKTLGKLMKKIGKEKP